MPYTGITVTRQGAPVLPHAISFDPQGTRATLRTGAFDGPLQVGQEYRIACAHPVAATFTAKYVDLDGLTYRFDNVHQLAATALDESTTPQESGAASDDEAQAGEFEERLGTCYEDSNCSGNVRGNNVSKAVCWRDLQGKSWKANDAPRCWEN
jgi:hypothetical protein